ncbi:hypothetical protein NBRC10512_007838 [Rhodotorula toruloides]|uniref:RHTO0S02e15852g1_1 n=2 Tax=Rhodotorula toruloides TaxID=5286 RepID=A0A061AJ14_RHOTO|nr:uncharacterized protein RHTO_07078 [Rhodotorula toruloides NP11]EMS23344.1 hypothetical protein RHTO_07078 [Rhodotorula toruloides NP11]CDR37514.1 RHTO0S02e15852g1_1 [Rhodotorula toruloides]
MTVPLAAPAAARALYRSLLRVAMRMPDDHRSAFVVHRARSEFDKSRSLSARDDVAARLLEGEIYRDQLELQADHLSALARQQTLIPVDLRSSLASPPASAPPPSSPSPHPSASSSSRLGPSRPTRPSRPPPLPPAISASEPNSPSPPSPPSADRRKLLRAISARNSQSRVLGVRRNRFMEGPEPSWIRRKREDEQKAEGKSA